MPVAGRQFPATAAVFFQSNRYLLEALYRDASRAAAEIPPGTALDAFGGVGFFAAALADAGHTVTTVEADGAAVELAREAKKRWADAWTIERSAVLPYLEHRTAAFDVAVADPPRAGLGLALSAALARRVHRTIYYVSCDPSTLARDLAVLLAEGFEVRRAVLYDLFAWTHRVEAAVTLGPARPR
jgi:tRNA/tmRNA/rRNA uracil-C5-methylase (TrmA/RlmC/RlmD family)